MSLKLESPVEKEYHLFQSDKIYGEEGEEKTYIKVRQASADEISIWKDMVANFIRQYDGEDVSVEQSVGLGDIERKEAFLTLSACGISNDDEEETPYFNFQDGRIKDEKEFYKAWNFLPAVITAEIVVCVRDLNEQWSPEGEG